MWVHGYLKELEIDNKASIRELAVANFKRLQEALRTVEENLKVIDKYRLSKIYENFRFDTYELEKIFLKKSPRKKEGVLL